MQAFFFGAEIFCCYAGKAGGMRDDELGGDGRRLERNGLGWGLGGWVVGILMTEMRGPTYCFHTYLSMPDKV